MNSKEYWREKLGLLPHPEGGYFKETYRSVESVPGSSLPARYGGDRVFATQIYFMLVKRNFSAFHRVASDETWHFYDGSPVVLHLLDHSGAHRIIIGIGEGMEPQFTVPAGTWFAAEVEEGGEFSLVGCSVAPGFDFADFEMAKGEELYRQFPFEVVKRLCRE